MLRLVLLLLYLAASFAVSGRTDIGGGLDPNGLTVQPPPAPSSDIGGGWDPNG